MRLAMDARVVKKNPSGVGSVVVNLLSRLELLNKLEITAFTQRGITEIDGLKKTKIVELDFLYQFVGKERFRFEQNTFQKIIQDCNPDIVHFTDSFGIPPLLPKSIKTILTLHDLIPMTSYRELMTESDFDLYKKSMASSLRRADRIVCISDFTRKDLKKYFPRYVKKSIVIKNGISKPGIGFKSKKNTVLRKYGLSKPYFLYLGGFPPRKNIINLVKAFILFNKNNEYQLLLPGRMSDKPDIKKNINKIKKLIISKDITKSIILTDYVSEQEKVQLLEEAKFFIYPSLYEGFGLPVLEALSLGTPVLTSKNTAMEEIGGRGVKYFDPKDITNIALIMRKSISNYEKLKEDAFKEKSLVVKDYCWENVANAYYGEYIKLAGVYNG